MRTVLGSVSARKENDRIEELARGNVTSATAIWAVLDDRASKYENLLVHFFNVDKPSTNTVTPVINISTNGATLETAAGYQYSNISWSATSAITATGNTTANFISLSSLNAAPFNMATLNGVSGDCIVHIVAPHRGGKAKIFTEWSFMNSASSPATSVGSGFFASGPIRGVALNHNAVTNFTGSYIAYGWGRAY